MSTRHVSLIGIALLAGSTNSVLAKSDYSPLLRVLTPSLLNDETFLGAYSKQSSNTFILNDSKSENLIQTEPKQRPSLYHVLHAEFLLNRGNIDDALQLYQQESFKNDATNVFERALSLSMQYESANATLQFAKNWQKQNPEHVPAQYYVAHLALKAFDYQTAEETLSQILEDNPQADLNEILTGIYPTNASAQQQLLFTLQSLPDHQNPAIRVMEAGLLAKLHRPEKALVSISQALSTKPDYVPYILLKADIIQQLQPSQEVLSYVSKERQRLKDKALYLYEIRYRLSLQEVKPAWNLLLEANDRFNDAEITLLASLVSIDIEAYEQADSLLTQLASKPHYLDQAYYYLGVSAERQGKLLPAERFFSKVMQDDLVLDARQKMVAIQLLRDDPDSALTTLQTLSRQFPVYIPDSAVLQADILRQMGNLDAAITKLEMAYTKFPDDRKLLYAYATILNGDDEQAAHLKRQLLERLLFIDPEDLSSQIAYANFLFSQNNQQDIERALQIADQILIIDFDSPNFEQKVYIEALNLKMANALADEQYQFVIDELMHVYEVTPNINTGIILIRAYQGLGQDESVKVLLADLKARFALGHKDINRLQIY